MRKHSRPRGNRDRDERRGREELAAERTDAKSDAADREHQEHERNDVGVVLNVVWSMFAPAKASTSTK